MKKIVLIASALFAVQSHAGSIFSEMANDYDCSLQSGESSNYAIPENVELHVAPMGFVLMNETEDDMLPVGPVASFSYELAMDNDDNSYYAQSLESISDSGETSGSSNFDQNSATNISSNTYNLSAENTKLVIEQEASISRALPLSSGKVTVSVNETLTFSNEEAGLFQTQSVDLTYSCTVLQDEDEQECAGDELGYCDDNVEEEYE